MTIKKIMVWAWMIGAALTPVVAQAVTVCEANKTLVVYTNGIFNTRKEAKKAKLKFETQFRLFRTAQPPATSIDGQQVARPPIESLDFQLAYVSDHTASNSTLADELFAVVKQRYGTSIIDTWLMLAELKAPSPEVKALMEALAAASRVAVVNDADLQRHLNQIYRPALSQGHRVLTVAHSQGNFYANAAYDALTNTLTGGNPQWAEQMQVVGVATPDSRVAGGGQYVTAYEDFVINTVRSASLPLTLPPLQGNTLNVFPFPDGMLIWFQSNGGHGFSSYYLQGYQTRSRILRASYNAVLRLAIPYNRREVFSMTALAINGPSPQNLPRFNVDIVDTAGGGWFVRGGLSIWRTGNAFTYTCGALYNDLTPTQGRPAATSLLVAVEFDSLYFIILQGFFGGGIISSAGGSGELAIRVNGIENIFSVSATPSEPFKHVIDISISKNSGAFSGFDVAF